MIKIINEIRFLETLFFFFFKASVVQRQKRDSSRWSFFYSNHMIGVARISRMHRWVFCKPRNPWLDFQKKYDPCCASSLRVHVKRMKRISNSEKEFHLNGGRPEGISIRKLEAHFRIVYFRWTDRHTRGAGPIMRRLHRPFAFESIVQRFPFSSITEPRYTSFLFDIELKKILESVYLFNYIRIICIVSMDIVFIVYCSFKFEKDEIRF